MKSLFTFLVLTVLALPSFANSQGRDTLPNAIEGMAYKVDLNKLFSVSGGPLTFGLTSGPAWVEISDEGILHGTPTKNDIGQNVANIAITNEEGLASSFSVTINVIRLNHAPLLSKHLYDLGSICAGSYYATTVFASATDADGDKLTWSIDLKPFMTFTWEKSQLSMSPTLKEVGLHEARLKVRDEMGAFDHATIRVHVVNCSR